MTTPQSDPLPNGEEWRKLGADHYQDTAKRFTIRGSRPDGGIGKACQWTLDDKATDRRYVANTFRKAKGRATRVIFDEQWAAEEAI